MINKPMVEQDTEKQISWFWGIYLITLSWIPNCFFSN